jgi:glycosyltransferase involved in cell wall biosynthesis
VRILTVTSSYPKYAGDTTAPFIASITKALAARGHELTVVLPARSDLDPEPIPGVRFCPFRYAPTEGLSVFGYAEALRADVALKHQTYLAAPLALLSGAKRLWTESGRQRYDLLHAHWVVPNGAMAWPASRGRKLPLVVSLHGSDVYLSEKKGAFRMAAKLALTRASAVTACSDDLAQRSLALGASQRPEVIPYGVDGGLFRLSVEASERARTLRRDLGIDPATIVVFAVGRLVRKKGFEYLIDAAATLSRAESGSFAVVIAGKGDLHAELEERARAKRVQDAVMLVGDIDRPSLPSYFAMADIVVVPSVRDAAGNVDGLPNVLLEAMASASAIVASDVAGISQAIRSGRDGILVAEKDPEALAAAIASLAASEEKRSALGESARTRALEAFNWNLVGERFESVFRTVAQTRCRTS